jgi:hypothetical protein
MKKLVHHVLALLLLNFCLTTAGKAQESVKLGQTGMQFLSVVSDARAAAMANAVTTLPMGSSSLFFNPAGMSESGFLDIAISHNQWIADIKHTTFSLSFKPSGNLGIFGLSVQSVDYGEILGTVVANNDQQYEDIGTIKVSALAIGLGYAKALTDQFSAGAGIRWVKQDLGQSIIPSDSSTTKVSNKLNPLVFDFGTSFKTGFKSLTFGMSVRNFASEVKYAAESFELPLTFTVGISMDMMDFIDDRSLVHSLLVSVDAVHNRDYREQLYLGAEVNLLNFLAIRGGYITNSDEDKATFGFGLSQKGLSFDYAYTPFGVFDKVQRFTLRFAL